MKSDDDGGKVFECDSVACSSTQTSRREFLQAASCFGVSVALLGLKSVEAAALPVAFTDGASSGGERQYLFRRPTA